MRQRNPMKVWPVQAAALTAVIFASFAEANNLSALNTLANQLKKARSLPAGSTTHFPCPQHMDQFVGMLSTNISSALGKPDYIDDDAEGDAPRVQRSWSYFLSSPKLPEVATDNEVTVSAGGGFPVVTFHVGRSNHIEHAECSYAR
jgi:hypothetical protein